ncbi:MAG: Mut7-C RNAse domain-containing protein [Acidobacteria bacterium]|nr:Mut7-C RNAse domain-containing protein [Acidobacteriota bacterium]
MRFLADSMLGRLARWLRFAGVDCGYVRDRQEVPFLERASREDRIILTADRGLASRAGGRAGGSAGGSAYVVNATFHRDQLKEVMAHFNLRPAGPLTRCGECNAPLAQLHHAEAYGRVPLRVYESAMQFFACPECGRLYWSGSHTEAIARTLSEILRPPSQGDRDHTPT